MHDLTNPVLLAQCAKIKAMVEEVSRIPARQKDYYAENHHWKLSPPASIEENEAFEKKAGIELPIEYVYFLTQVGRGGACPGTCFFDFPEKNYEWDKIAGVSEKLSVILPEEEWGKRYEYHENYEEPGVICLCGMDLTFEAYLIVTGPNRGRVVYLDYDGDMPPMWPKGSPDFLTWYENFFCELLADYKIYPTWKFMWQEPGEESDLIRALKEAEDLQYQKEVLGSFYKFKKLSDTTPQFLQSIKEPAALQEIAEDVLQYFSSKH